MANTSNGGFNYGPHLQWMHDIRIVHASAGHPRRPHIDLPGRSDPGPNRTVATARQFEGQCRASGFGIDDWDERRAVLTGNHTAGEVRDQFTR